MAQRKKKAAGKKTTTRRKKTEKKVTRYTYDEIKEPRTPETGHTPLLPGDEQVVTLPMDNAWSRAIEVGKLSKDDERLVVVDMDPTADTVPFWARKHNRREAPVLPFQRNEIVSESRIVHVVERVRLAAAEQAGAAPQGHQFADLEKALREANVRGEKLGLSEDELAFYDALETNDSAVKVLGEPILRTIAQELVRTVRANVTIDWTLRENVRAQLRVLVKRILRKHGYPPDKQEKATQTVLEQAEVLSAEWATA